MADIYAEPKRFNDNELARLKKIKAKLKSGAGGAEKRLRGEMRGLYSKGNARLNGDPTGPRTVGDLQREASSGANLKYGDAERSVQGEQRVSDQMQTNIGSWYDDYLTQIQGARDRTAQAYQQAEQRVRDAATAGSAQASQQNQQMQAQMQADAQRRGATLDPSTFATANQAAQSNQASANSFAGLVGSQGANASAALDNRKTAGAGEKVAQQLLERKRRGSIDKRLADLLTEKGQYRTQLIGEGRDNERKFKLEAAAFQLDTQQASDIARDRSIDNSREEQKFASEQEKDAYQRAHGLGPYKPASGGKGGGKPRKGLGSLTQGQENKIISDIGKAQGWIRKLRNANPPVPESEIRSILSTGGKIGPDGAKITVPAYDKDYINSAFDLEVNRHLSNPNVRALHNKGVHIPPKWQKKKSAIKKPVGGKGKKKPVG